jgi:hypothetical protein
MQDASLLRFLIDMRGADVDDRQVNIFPSNPPEQGSCQEFNFLSYIIFAFPITSF